MGFSQKLALKARKRLTASSPTENPQCNGQHSQERSCSSKDNNKTFFSRLCRCVHYTQPTSHTHTQSCLTLSSADPPTLPAGCQTVSTAAAIIRCRPPSSPPPLPGSIFKALASQSGGPPPPGPPLPAAVRRSDTHCCHYQLNHCRRRRTRLLGWLEGLILKRAIAVFQPLLAWNILSSLLIKKPRFQLLYVIVSFMFSWRFYRIEDHCQVSVQIGAKNRFHNSYNELLLYCFKSFVTFYFLCSLYHKWWG